MNHTTQELEHAVERAASTFQYYYLDWLNNFITIEGYANYYEITKEEAEQRIRIGTKIHNQRIQGGSHAAL